jgi:hypothetical protein
MHYGWIGSLSRGIAAETRKWAYRFAEFVSTVILPRDWISFTDLSYSGAKRIDP